MKPSYKVGEVVLVMPQGLAFDDRRYIGIITKVQEDDIPYYTVDMVIGDESIHGLIFEYEIVHRC